MKRILVPCDFSEPAIEAFKFAMDMAASSGGEIFVLKAVDLPLTNATSFDVQAYTYDPTILKDLEDAAKKNFEKLKKEFGHRSVPTSFHVQLGPVTPIIHDFTKHNKIDLIVMGTHGSSGFDEFFFGSNAEKIIRLSTVPVLAIRKAPAFDSIKKIVVPTTLELNQTDFINKIKELQSFFGATLHLLWVNTPGNFKRHQALNNSLEEIAKHYKLDNYTLNIRGDYNEQDGILAFAHEIKANMIAMATHGRRGLGHMFLRSIAEDVVNHLQCPIWTYSTHKK